MPNELHFLRQPIVIFAELHVRMRVGSGREGNSFRHRQLDDRIARIKFVHRFAPTGGGELDRQIARRE